MQLKLAALALASASTVLAAEEAAGAFSLPPQSILNVLATAVPTSVLGELDDLNAISSWAEGLASSIEHSQTPGWVASLPPSVKSYLYTAYVPDAAAPTPTGSNSGTAANTGSVSTATAPASAASTATGAATTAASAASNAPSGTTSVSTGGAVPAPTGALAAGLTGAMGVLGLALAL